MLYRLQQHAARARHLEEKLQCRQAAELSALRMRLRNGRDELLRERAADEVRVSNRHKLVNGEAEAEHRAERHHLTRGSRLAAHTPRRASARGGGGGAPQTPRSGGGRLSPLSY